MMPHTVTILRAETVQDRYGNQRADSWVAAAISPAFMQPRQGSEDTSIGDVQVGDGVCYLPLAAEVTGRDRLEHNGIGWDIVGPPDRWETGSTLDHQRVVLRRVDDTGGA